jgi:hypothetical protein
MTDCYVDFTMLTNERQMARRLLRLMERHMQSSSASWLRQRRKVPGCRPLSRVRDIRTLVPIDYSTANFPLIYRRASPSGAYVPPAELLARCPAAYLITRGTVAAAVSQQSGFLVYMDVMPQLRFVYSEHMSSKSCTRQRIYPRSC